MMSNLTEYEVRNLPVEVSVFPLVYEQIEVLYELLSIFELGTKVGHVLLLCGGKLFALKIGLKDFCPGIHSY